MSKVKSPAADDDMLPEESGLRSTKKRRGRAPRFESLEAAERADAADEVGEGKAARPSQLIRVFSEISHPATR